MAGKRMTRPNAPKEIKKPAKQGALPMDDQREEWNRCADIVRSVATMTGDTKLRVLKGIGVGTDYFTCYMCGEVKPKAAFYTSTDFNVRSGVSRICKDCCDALVNAPSQTTTDAIDGQREALKTALEYLDVPFFERIYQAAIRESSSKTKANAQSMWGVYKRTIAGASYRNQRYHDGEGYVIDRTIAETEDGNKTMTIEELEEFNKNKADALRVVGYYPFEDAPLVDQPLLYAQFSGYLEGQSDDYPPYWLASVISIIRDTWQMTKIDHALNELTKDTAKVVQNIPAITDLTAAKTKLSTSIAKTAQENCISLKNTRSNQKGTDTWTGRMKQLRDLDLHDYDVNRFDIETAGGMQQVADISMRSILKEISLDENDYTEILKTQRELLAKAQHESSVSQERARLLLKENMDLKRYMHEQGLHFEHLLQNEDLFNSAFFSADINSIELDSEKEKQNVFDVEFYDVDKDADETDESGDSDEPSSDSE